METNTKTRNQFIEHLRTEYLERLKKNPQYSMRAFAQSLGVNDSTLAKIIRGARKPSEKYMANLGVRLGLESEKLDSMINNRNTTFEKVDRSEISFHSDWIFDAILELTYLHKFEPSVKFVADTFGLSTLEAEDKLEKLFKTGKLEKQNNGNWVNKTGFTSTYLSPNFEAESLKNYQLLLGRKSSQSIMNEPIENKDHASYISAMDTDLIPEIKEILKRTRREIAELIETKSKKRDMVYGITTNLFPLNQKIDN